MLNLFIVDSVGASGGVGAGEECDKGSFFQVRGGHVWRFALDLAYDEDEVEGCVENMGRHDF